MKPMRVGFSVGLVGVIAALASAASAGTGVGKLELPAVDRGPVIAKGFLDRVENPLAEIKKPNIAPYFIVALEGEARAGGPAPAEVKWDLVGESFARPVIGVPVGTEVVIKNRTKLAWTIGAAEDAKLMVGPLNPQGTKSFRATAPAVYTIGDKDAPYLRGKIVVVATPYVAALDDGGRFEMTNVPDGTYKLRVYYYDPAAEARGRASAWLPFTTAVTVATKGKLNRAEVSARLTAADLLSGPASGPVPGKK